MKNNGHRYLIAALSILILSGVQATVLAEDKDSGPRYDLLDKMAEFYKADSSNKKRDNPSKTMTWFKSLPKEDFVRGLKQVNDKIVEYKKTTSKVNGEYLIGYAYMGAGFAQYYFRAYPDSSPMPFLKMAKDHSMDKDFRDFVLDYMGDDDFYSLKDEHFDVFCKVLLEIISDESNSIKLREEASDCLQRSTGRLFFENKNSDERLKNIKKLDEILKMPKGQLSEELREFFAKFARLKITLGKVLVETGDKGITFHERSRLVRMLKGVGKSKYMTDSKLVDLINKRVSALEKFNSDVHIQVVEKFLTLLKKTTSKKEAIEMLSENFNYNGVMYSKQEVKRIQLMSKVASRFSYARTDITVKNLQAFKRSEYSRYFRRKRFSKQYRVNSNDVFWMLHFEVHTYFNDIKKGFVDGVFIGLDINDKVVAWFD